MTNISEEIINKKAQITFDNLIEKEKSRYGVGQ